MGKLQGLDPAQFFRFKKRDHAIFDQVYAMYHRVCYVVIYSILKHHETSEDVLQDVFLKAYEKAPTCRHQDSLQAWLVLIARNTALNVLAKQKELAWQEAYDDYVTSLEKPDMFQTWHKQLSDQENLLLAYRLVYDLGFETIAALLNISVSAAHKRYQSILEKIKEDYR
jgi:RNA polymerase sigma-70 factor (ECF subfamily)